MPEAPCKVNGNTGPLPGKLIYHIPKISQWSLRFKMFGAAWTLLSKAQFLKYWMSFSVKIYESEGFYNPKEHFLEKFKWCLAAQLQLNPWNNTQN